ncbi:hypothetical protein BDY19DRAFT_904736 [Irpex rosettiformis]|uniref:Uncharacterized protein n=1 Tax=Irpex rosettiformis TaxID=378272 RepID=A0ACB8UAI7_9APHY|nr:hypothetical protein BDY19DRAFT_904736 [Irpex rosettiformis]
MKTFAAFVALAAAGSALAQQFTINTPSGVLQCVPAQLTFSGGTGPFFLAINTPDANGAALQTYDGITASPFQWSANISANTQLGLSLTDRSNGNKALSGVFTVGASGDNSCLNGAAAPSSSSETASSAAGSSSSAATSGSASSAATSAGTSAATSAATSVTSATGVTSATTGTSARSGSTSGSASHTSSGSAASASGTSRSGAFSNTASVGFVGFVGAIAALVMA